MKNTLIISLISLLVLNKLTAQIYTGNPIDLNNKNIIANFSGANTINIKGFSIPNYSLSNTTDPLGDANINNMRNSLLIFNNNTNLNKGLYYWENTQWTILADNDYLDKLSKLSSMERKINTITRPTTEYNMGNNVGNSGNKGIHTIGELYNYNNNDINWWTDLSFQEGTNKVIVNKNANNINKLTLSGSLQVRLPSAPGGQIQKGVFGIAIFVKNNSTGNFELKDHKIISTYINSNVCSKISFDFVSILKNLPIGNNEIKVALEKREVFNIDDPSNTNLFTTRIGVAESTCNSTTYDTQRLYYLPKSATQTNLVIETYENPNF